MSLLSAMTRSFSVACMVLVPPVLDMVAESRFRQPSALPAGPTEEGHRGIGADPRAEGGEGDIGPVLRVADDGEGGEQVPGAAPACRGDPPAGGDGGGEHHIHRVGRGSGGDGAGRDQRVDRREGNHSAARIMAKACRTVAARISVRSPGKTWRSVMVGRAERARPKQTRPTGFS